MQNSAALKPYDLMLGDEGKIAELLGRGYTQHEFLSVDDIAALSKLHRDTLPSNASEYYVTAFSNDIDSKRFIFERIRDIVRAKVQQLMPGYDIVNASFVTKKAGSTRGRLPLHQDYSLVDHEVDLGLNAWIPLSDVDDSNGCMRMVEYSSHFNHISATPPNPSPYDGVRSEIEAQYLTDVPMPAGTAVVFDTRLLHATEENRTRRDRVAVFLNLCPRHTTPRLNFWNAAVPDRLEVYEVDTEFMLNLPPNRYLEESEKAGAKFVGYVKYTPIQWTAEELKARIPQPAAKASPVASAKRAIEYLVASQLTDGEFQTEFCYNRREDVNGQPVEDLMFDSSPFVTSLVLYSMQFAKGLNPAVVGTTSRGLRFLTSEMDQGGLWRYWTRKNPKRNIIPPDLDDTACISHLLQSHGIAIPNNRALFYDSRDKRGAFYTWLYKANSLGKWMLWLRTGGKAFSYTKELWQWTSGDDVCAVVNANVLMYLGATPGTQKTIEYLLDTLRIGNEDKEIVFYAHRMSLYYMASRALFTGVRALAPARQTMIDRIMASQLPDGSFGDELLTGLAVCSLLNLDERPAGLAHAIGYLVKTQREDGSWQRIPMYGGPPTPTTFGSVDLTTGICLEALARYSA